MTKTLPDNLPLAGRWLVPSETFADKETRRYLEFTAESGHLAAMLPFHEWQRLSFPYARRALPRPLYTRTGRPM